MVAVQEAVMVSNSIERLQADTVMEVVDQLTPFSGGRLAIYDGVIDRERLSRIASEYGMGYARFALLTALFYAQEIGGFPFQIKAIEEIAGSSRCPDEPSRLSSDLDRLMDSRSPEGLDLAKVFLPQLGPEFAPATFRSAPG